jgi:hypothetical protein
LPPTVLAPASSARSAPTNPLDMKIE